MKYLYENAWLIVLVLAAVALLVLLFKMWRARKQCEKLERDKCGLWRYHRQTQFRRQEAFGSKLRKVTRVYQQAELKEKSADVASGKDGSAKVIAVIQFKGDLRAKEHTALASLVDELEVNAESLAEVVVCVNSTGGMIAQYGHAFSQMERIRRLGVALTVCIDVVAASGGYLMSIPGTKIIAAPFAIIGSIGVVAFVPNIRKFLTNINIEPRTFTAGRYKRTVTLTDNATSEEVAHFTAQLETIHSMFSAAVGKYRTQVNVETVATGEHWTAQESVEKNLGLVDELGTAHEYLLKRNREHALVHISQRQSFWEDGIGLFISTIAGEIEARFAARRLPF